MMTGFDVLIIVVVAFTLGFLGGAVVGSVETEDRIRKESDNESDRG